MTILAIGSARISWTQTQRCATCPVRKMLVIEAQQTNPRAKKHAKVMLSEYEVRQLRAWLDETQGSVLDGT